MCSDVNGNNITQKILTALTALVNEEVRKARIEENKLWDDCPMCGGAVKTRIAELQSQGKGENKPKPKTKSFDDLYRSGE